MLKGKLSDKGNILKYGIVLFILLIGIAFYTYMFLSLESHDAEANSQVNNEVPSFTISDVNEEVPQIEFSHYGISKDYILDKNLVSRGGKDVAVIPYQINILKHYYDDSGNLIIYYRNGTIVVIDSEGNRNLAEEDDEGNLVLIETEDNNNGNNNNNSGRDNDSNDTIIGNLPDPSDDNSDDSDDSDDLNDNYISDISKIIDKVKEENSIDIETDLVLALISVSSNFNETMVDKAKDDQNVSGLMQITDETFKFISEVLLDEPIPENKIAPEVNIKYGLVYLDFISKTNLDNDKHYLLTAYRKGIRGAKEHFEEFGTYESDFSTKVIGELGVIGNDTKY